MAWGSSSNYNNEIKSLVEEGKLNYLPHDCFVIAFGNSKAIWQKILEYQAETGTQNPFDDLSK